MGCDIVGIGATIWLWFAFWVSHIIVLVLQLVWFILFAWWMPKKWYRKSVSRFHFLTIFLLVTINPFWWVKVHRRPEKMPTGGAIAMFNHICFADPWLVGSILFPKFAYFASSEFVFKLPVLGWVMRLTGHVEVKFEVDENGKPHVKNGASLLRYSRNLLEMGENLAVFPEGKLSYDLKVLEFKLGYFRLAKETGKPILPIAMWGNEKLYPPGNQFQLAQYGVANISIGDPVYPDDYDTAEELAEVVRDMVILLQRNLPTYPRDNIRDSAREDSLSSEAFTGSMRAQSFALKSVLKELPPLPEA